ncbi:MAG: NAD(P)(+) transhydrogenase (Re/Si-specific) subunit beta [Halofilum sp. (in: g-proteobacteria)]|nr:NAD(P)(+) transhydrogenase (Re/Si-specific) subunit beta [Halofilum sp. (in: g-proteobacteria)]
MSLLIQTSYFVAAVLFILGLKAMSSPKTARRGVIWAGAGMVLATVVTFLHEGLHNYALMVIAIVAGGGVAWVSAKRVAMTDMPQMIAVYNGMGGGAAAAIAANELLADHVLAPVVLVLAVLGALIGTVAFTGSVIAFAKLQGLIRKSPRSTALQLVNLLIGLGAVAAGVALALGQTDVALLAAFFAAAAVFGVLITLPIGGADMPVVISLFNALTGLAVGFEGFVLGNPAMMIAGIVVGASGTLLTQLMAKAMNRSLGNVLFAGFGADEGTESAGDSGGTMKAIDATDAAIMLAYANRVIIVPGYGMAVAQAQHKIWELTELLEDRGVKVKFAIHPVAGRMPGHMNVLLAEAGVPYDKIADLEEINAEFARADVAVVIGANDVVNPAARSNKDSPIYGMPILNVDQAQHCIVIKRGKGTGFSGIENELFFAENTSMLYGDGQKAASELIAGVKTL